MALGDLQGVEVEWSEEETTFAPTRARHEPLVAVLHDLGRVRLDGADQLVTAEVQRVLALVDLGGLVAAITADEQVPVLTALHHERRLGRPTESPHLWMLE